jgi:hypothetical protein
MAVAWTDITNAQVAAGAPLTTALMTALRDNPEGIVQRATGAPKIFGVPYDFQEFTTAGTWTKPGNAEVGDRVFIQVVGGGEAGDRAARAVGGGGGAGVTLEFPIGDLPATLSIVGVGAGGAGTSGVGGNGGDTVLGTAFSDVFVRAQGGTGNASNSAQVRVLSDDPAQGQLTGASTKGGNAGSNAGGTASPPDENGYEGAGGGGAAVLAIGATQSPGAPSMRAGDGGYGRVADTTGYAGSEDGRFPGGGGGGVRNIAGLPTGGNGADGVVRIWCVKDK